MPKSIPTAVLSLGSALDGLVLAEQGHVPALGGVQDTEALDGCTLLGSGRVHRMSSGASILASVNLPSAKRNPLRVNSAEPPALLLEAGVLGPLGEEIGVAGLKVAQRLLDRNARNLVKKRKLGIFLPAGEGGALARVPDGFLPRGPRFAAFVQGAIVDERQHPMVLRSKTSCSAVG